MKKLTLIICGLLLISTAAIAQSELKPLMPPYWIVGALTDFSTTVSANGRQAVFYKNDDELYKASHYAVGIVSNNTFIINAFEIWPATLEVGQTYKVAVFNDPSDHYGADPRDITISGRGWDEITGLVLAYGAGPQPPITGEVYEAAPAINLWVGNRLYQPGYYWVERKGNVPFIIPTNPEIKVDLSIPSPDTLAKIEDQSIIIDAGTTYKITLTLTPANVTSTSYAAGTTPQEGKVTAQSFKYTIIEPPLSEGMHTISVIAKSSGSRAFATTTSLFASAEVIKGPLRLLGTPITFPSPFSISKQKIVTIQYALSTNANIDIYIISVGGERIKRFLINAGAEGGSAGINKITWDGVTDQGYLAGNAIYVGTIIARDEGKLLRKFKLTIVD